MEHVLSYLYLKDLKTLSKVSVEPKSLADEVYEKRYKKIVNKLIGSGTNLINEVDQDGESLLYKAAEHGRIDEISVLLENGANVEQEDNAGRRPLHIVALQGHYTAFKLLVDEGKADIHSKTNIGSSMLLMAARSGNTGLILHLLSHGLNIDECNADGLFPLAGAAFNGHLSAMKLLLERGANMEPEGFDMSIYGAIFYEEVEVVHFLIEEGLSNINKEVKLKGSIGKGYFSPLSVSCHNENTSMVKYLISKGANINARSERGYYTALTDAIYNGHVEIVKVLLENGANVELEDSVGKRALHLAAYEGHLEMVEHILKVGKADINSKTSKHGNTAINIAVKKKKLDIFHYLVNQGADVNRYDNLGNGPLHEATRSGQMEVVKLLVEVGKADLNAKNNNGDTPLLEAMNNKHIVVTRYLINLEA